MPRRSAAADLVRLHKNIASLSDGQASIFQQTEEDADKDGPIFTVQICPKDGPYQHGTFYFEFTLPADYPLSPPNVYCMTPIFHPNIDLPDGDDIPGGVCLSLFDSEWNHSCDLCTCVQGLLFLLHNPNLDDPLDPEFPVEFSQEAFERCVKRSLLGQTLNGISFPRNCPDDVMFDDLQVPSVEEDLGRDLCFDPNLRNPWGPVRSEYLTLFDPDPFQFLGPVTSEWVQVNQPIAEEFYPTDFHFEPWASSSQATASERETFSEENTSGEFHEIHNQLNTWISHNLDKDDMGIGKPDTNTESDDHTYPGVDAPSNMHGNVCDLVASTEEGRMEQSEILEENLKLLQGTAPSSVSGITKSALSTETSMCENSVETSRADIQKKWSISSLLLIISTLFDLIWSFCFVTFTRLFERLQSVLVGCTHREGKETLRTVIREEINDILKENLERVQEQYQAIISAITDVKENLVKLEHSQHDMENKLSNISKVVQEYAGIPEKLSTLQDNISEVQSLLNDIEAVNIGNMCLLENMKDYVETSKITNAWPNRSGNNNCEHLSARPPSCLFPCNFPVQVSSPNDNVAYRAGSNTYCGTGSSLPESRFHYYQTAAPMGRVPYEVPPRFQGRRPLHRPRTNSVNTNNWGNQSHNPSSSSNEAPADWNEPSFFPTVGHWNARNAPHPHSQQKKLVNPAVQCFKCLQFGHKIANCPY